jgi:4,5-dihydroxyphthalate decarboxylase
MSTIERLSLSLAVQDNLFTRPILAGRIAPQGAKLVCTAVHPSEIFWRQLKFSEFDLSEMSLSSLMIAASKGDTRWAALPIFTMRSFFHTGIMVRADAKIKEPRDLIGKRVGVPEYQQTSAIWSRGILQHEFGVNPTQIEWFMERTPDKSHGGSTGFQAPVGVKLNQIPQTTNIGEMLAGGELDATLLYLTDKNLVDRSRLDLIGQGIIRPLFADPEQEKRRYFAKTGVMPINHAIVMRRSLLEMHPWVALNVYTAFLSAKAEVANIAETFLKPYLETGVMSEQMGAALKLDPMGYGMKAARPVLETIAQYVHEQGLTARKVQLEEVFAPNTMDI